MDKQPYFLLKEKLMQNEGTREKQGNITSNINTVYGIYNSETKH